MAARLRSLLAFLCAISIAAACQRPDDAAVDEEAPPPARPAGVATDWVYHAPGDLAVEWWAPATLMSADQTPDLPACDSATPPADSAIALLGEGDRSLPLTVDVRRGTRDSVVDANHFARTDEGDYVTQGRGSGQASSRVGARWIVLAGDVWVARAGADSAAAGQEPLSVLLGVADAGGGCQLVFLERGEGAGSMDTLAAVLATVRPRTP